MQTITDRIATGMKDLGLSVKALADETGIPRVTLMRRLDRPETLTIAEVNRISDALGINILDTDVA